MIANTEQRATSQKKHPSVSILRPTADGPVCESGRYADPQLADYQGLREPTLVRLDEEVSNQRTLQGSVMPIVM